MKKLFTVLAIFVLVFAGCPSDDGNDNEGGNSATMLRIRNQSSKSINTVAWNDVAFVSKENADVLGTWTGNAGNSYLVGTIRLIVGERTWTMSDDELSDGGTWTRNGNNFSFRSSQPVGNNGTAILSAEKLTLNIMDFMDSFIRGTAELTSNNLDLSIATGVNVTKTVGEGTTFIFFKVGSALYRTTDVVSVAKNEAAEFNFTSNTLVVDVDDPNTPLTLGSL